jgi:hypothetical protein
MSVPTAQPSRNLYAELNPTRSSNLTERELVATTYATAMLRPSCTKGYSNAGVRMWRSAAGLSSAMLIVTAFGVQAS